MSKRYYYYWLEQARNYLALHALGLADDIAFLSRPNPRYYLDRARTILESLRTLRTECGLAQ